LKLISFPEADSWGDLLYLQNKIQMINRSLFVRVISCAVAVCFMLSCTLKPIAEIRGPIVSVPFTAVHLTDSFWAPRIRLNHDVTIPIAFHQSEITGRIKNFEVAGKLKKGTFSGIYPFDDSDVYKIIEGASYSLQSAPDSKLEAYLDTLIYKISKAQEPDGYLYTNRTILGLKAHAWAGTERWVNDHVLSHELYNLGHLFEAAVAHYQATGKRTLLDVAIKAANLVDKDFGWNKLVTYPGHQEIEIGLAKLYRVTHDERYIKLAKFFLDARSGGEEYNQANKKVLEQTEAVGHAVRACYMYSGMADVAALMGDSAYMHAIDKIWEDIVYKKLYITGGIGATGGNEGFAGAYNLPNGSAYCETCASIAFILFNQRLFLAHGQSKYIDVMERTLYNAMLSGISLSGDHFFYPNPLESYGQHSRSEWFGCACCPSNICRFIPSIPGYVYATCNTGIIVNLYVSSDATIKLDSSEVVVSQKSRFPWDGQVELTINPKSPKEFSLFLRIPGWAKNDALPGGLYKFNKDDFSKVALKVNGSLVRLQERNGYAVVTRIWKKGDKVSLNIPMQVRTMHADERVGADKGKIAVQRGPFVYCAEFADNKAGHVLSLVGNSAKDMYATFKASLLNGIETVNMSASISKSGPGNSIILDKEQEATLIPYYAWSNRGSGEMMVWLPMTKESAHPLPAPTIASESKVTASKITKDLFAVNDQQIPDSSNDQGVMYYHWWPENNSWVWIQYDFKAAQKVNSAAVYWFDDGPSGGCRIPDAWEISYLDNGQWKPVKIETAYTITKNAFDKVKFNPVQTNALRLRVKLNKKFSAGVYEWSLE
jgi:DUF1680 family protein